MEVGSNKTDLTSSWWETWKLSPYNIPATHSLYLEGPWPAVVKPPSPSLWLTSILRISSTGDTKWLLYHNSRWGRGSTWSERGHIITVILYSKGIHWTRKMWGPTCFLSHIWEPEPCGYSFWDLYIPENISSCTIFFSPSERLHKHLRDS